MILSLEFKKICDDTELLKKLISRTDFFDEY